MKVLLQIMAAVICILAGAFFSGTETGIYRLSRFRLRVGIEQKRRMFIILGHAMQDAHSLMLSMLIGTNLANYIVTSIVTVMLLAAVKSRHAAELYATVLMAPTLFIFSELIPKNIYFYRADTLLPRFAVPLWGFHKLFTWSGMVPLLKLISKSTDTAETSLTDRPRRHISQIVKETHEEGLLSTVQSEMMHRLVNIPNIRLSHACVPVSEIEMINVNTDKPTLLDKLKKTAYTRLPAYKDTSNNIVGFINIYEALTCDKDFTDLHAFLKPIQKFSADTLLIDAINKMRTENTKIALVTQSRRRQEHKPVGIVTMKDLVEELTGELAEW